MIMFELKRDEERIVLDRSGVDTISDKIVEKLKNTESESRIS